MGVEESDVYQMLAYARAYGAERLILLYPWRKELCRKGIQRTWIVAEPTDRCAAATVPKEREDAPGREGGPCRLDIAAVDVGRPDAVADALCAIVDSGAPS